MTRTTLRWLMLLAGLSMPLLEEHRTVVFRYARLPSEFLPILGALTFTFTPLAIFLFFALGPIRTAHYQHVLFAIGAALYFSYFLVGALTSYPYLDVQFPQMVYDLLYFYPPAVSLLAGWVLSRREARERPRNSENVRYILGRL